MRSAGRPATKSATCCCGHSGSGEPGSNGVAVASPTLTAPVVSVFWLPGDSSGAADKLQAGIPMIRTSEITARRTTSYPTRPWRVRKRFSVPEMMRRTLERWAKMISVARPTLAQNG